MNETDYIIKQFSGTVSPAHPMDVQHGFLYDTLSLPPSLVAGLLYKFFSIPQGDIDPITKSEKGLTDTNMSISCRLPAPEAFAVQRLVFTFDKGASEKDVMAIAENCVFHFSLGHKYYLRSLVHLLPCQRREFEPLRLCGKCKTLYLGDGHCPSCASSLRPMPLPGSTEAGRQFFLDLLINLTIENQMSFRVLLYTEKPLKLKGPVRVWCHLEGLHARGVQ